MERIELRTQSRTIHGKEVKQLRAEGWVPAVLYGPDTLSRSIQSERRSTLKALQLAGLTALIDLYVDDKPKPIVVLAREVQHEPLTGRLQHVDFYQVRLTEKVKTSPRLEIVGESPLVKSGGAVMVQILNEVEVECLPADLIGSIPVDVSALESVNDSVVIGDLPVPPGVTFLSHPNDIVVSLVLPRIAREEEEEEMEAEMEAEEAAVEEALVEEEGTSEA